MGMVCSGGRGRISLKGIRRGNDKGLGLGGGGEGEGGRGKGGRRDLGGWGGRGELV